MVCLSLTTKMLLGLLFARAYGKSFWDGAYSVIQTSDGGYAFAGYTESPSADGYDVLVVKLNSSGLVQWAKAYGGIQDDIPCSLIQTTDGGYAVAGTSWSFGSGPSDPDFFLFKLSSNGSLQWAKAYHYSDRDRCYQVIQTADNGYALVGKIYYNEVKEEEFYVIKTGSDGSVQWTRACGSTIENETARSIAQLSDGSYVVVGTAYNLGDSGVDRGVFIVKVSSDGVPQWYKVYYNPDMDYLVYSLAVALTGDFMIAGIAVNPGTGRSDFLALMLNPDGSIDWARTIGGTQYDTAFSVFRASDGGYVFAGATNSYGAGYLDFMVAKLSANGNFQWARTLGTASYNDAAYSVIQMSDGTFAVAGQTPGYGAGGQDAFVLKLSSTGVYTDCVQTCTPTVATPSLLSTLFGFSSTPVAYATVRTPSLTVQNANLSTEDACPTAELGEGLAGTAPEIICLSVPGGLVFSSGTEAILRLYFPDGRLVRSLRLEKGENRLSLEPGAYLWMAGDYLGKAVVR